MTCIGTGLGMVLERENMNDESQGVDPFAPTSKKDQINALGSMAVGRD